VGILAAMELYLGARRLDCLMCGGTRFDHREILMNTAGLTFLDLDWANKTAMGAICRTCGHVHTFMGDAVELRAPRLDQRDEPAPWMDADGL
jgi:predicted nucleic-acid-binding Zn-ribbon protein